MAKARPRHFPPPLKGLEWRDVFQDTEGEAITADCMLNVETSYGELRERKGFEHLTACPAFAQIHVTDHPNKHKRLITVGKASSSNDIEAQVHNLTTGETKTTNITSLNGESYFDGFRCSFVPVRLPGTAELAFDATLIVTPLSTYCVLPSGSIRQASMEDAALSGGGDVLRENEDNISYIASVPRGPIAVSHADKVFYMGWGPRTSFSFTSVLEDAQVLVPGVILDPGGGSYTLGSDWLMFSDEFSSLDIQAPHCRRTDNREEITGAASFKDVLVVFTDVSMYVLLGSSALDFQLRKIDGSVGCVSHWSIVEANGLLYWMARDGIYAFDGSKATKVSVGIDQFWSEELRSDFVPSTFRDAAKSLGWPFSASKKSLGLVNAVHYRDRSLVLWSIPSPGRSGDYISNGRNALPVTLVYDYKHGGFYFWAMPNFREGSSSVPGTCMYDGVSVVQGAEETLFTTGFTKDGGSIRKYGRHCDLPAPNIDFNVPFLWITGRIDKNVMGTARIQSTRFSIKSRGATLLADINSDVRWSVFDATTVHQLDLDDFSGPLPMFPVELLEDMNSGASPLLGSTGLVNETITTAFPDGSGNLTAKPGALGEMVLVGLEYFKSKGGGCRSTDGSLRVALYSSGGFTYHSGTATIDPGNTIGDVMTEARLRMNAWAFEIDRGDTR